MSDNNFNITIVLLNANQTAKYSDVNFSNHKSIPIKNQIIVVIRTCRNHVLIAVFQISLIIFGFNSNHTINNKNAIHILENVSIAKFSCKIFGTAILNIVPAIIYQIIIGCLKTLVTHMVIKTTHIIMLK